MRHNSRRSKGKNNNNNNGNGQRRSGVPARMHVYDSNGPDVRIRGTAYQVCEKYLALAKDAAGAGDRIMAENYLQHAEHYQRIINSFSDHAAPAVKMREAPEVPDMDDMETGEDMDLGLPASMVRAVPDTLIVKKEEMENV